MPFRFSSFGPSIFSAASFLDPRTSPSTTFFLAALVAKDFAGLFFGEDLRLALPFFFGDFLGEALLTFFWVLGLLTSGWDKSSVEESSSDESVEEAVEDVSLPSSEI